MVKGTIFLSFFSIDFDQYLIIMPWSANFEDEKILWPKVLNSARWEIFHDFCHLLLF